MVIQTFALLSVKVIHSREDFLSRIFSSTRPRHESDCQATCNLLLHMQQKVVMNLVAALPRCAFAALRLCVESLLHGYGQAGADTG
jgi:hypothetical protein